MKKTLIALAAVAAVSSAMADVSITGYIDRAAMQTTNSNATKSSTLVYSAAGTSGIFFKGNEMLNSDLSALFSLETDFSENGGNTQTTAIPNAQVSGFNNGESYIGLTSKSMGALKLGDPNSYMLGAVTSVGAPAFGTGLGSSFSSKFSIFSGVGTGDGGTNGGVGTLSAASSSAAVTGARDIRIANTIQYTTPSFSGVTFGVGFTPQNNNATASPGNTNSIGVTEYNLRYTSGPIDATYDSIKYIVGANGVSQTSVFAFNSNTVAVNSIAGNVNSTHNYAGINFAVNDSIKLHGGYGNFTTTDTAASNGRSTQVGVTYKTGQWELLAQDAQVQDTATTATNRTMFGAGVNYWFSKTTRAYVRYDSINYASNTTAFSGSTQTRQAVGLSTSF